MAKNLKRKDGAGRRRADNRTETCADALRRAFAGEVGGVVRRMVARKRTSAHGEVLVEVVGSRVLVVGKEGACVPMRDQESALAWLDNL